MESMEECKVLKYWDKAQGTCGSLGRMYGRESSLWHPEGRTLIWETLESSRNSIIEDIGRE